MTTFIITTSDLEIFAKSYSNHICISIKGDYSTGFENEILDELLQEIQEIVCEYYCYNIKFDFDVEGHISSNSMIYFLQQMKEFQSFCKAKYAILVGKNFSMQNQTFVESVAAKNDWDIKVFHTNDRVLNWLENESSI